MRLGHSGNFAAKCGVESFQGLGLFGFIIEGGEGVSVDIKKKNFLRWRYSGRDNVGSRSEATMVADIVFGFSALALFHREKRTSVGWVRVWWCKDWEWDWK